MEKLIYGTAYYDEYMPYDRLAEDVEMMKKAGINTVRIAESTWSTCEPQEGVFDFSHVERVLDAMEEAGIQVILKDEVNEHFALIDEELVWHGGMNLLGKEDVWDNLMRIRSAVVAEELLELALGKS